MITSHVFRPREFVQEVKVNSHNKIFKIKHFQENRCGYKIGQEWSYHGMDHCNAKAEEHEFAFGMLKQCKISFNSPF